MKCGGFLASFIFLMMISTKVTDSLCDQNLGLDINLPVNAKMKINDEQISASSEAPFCLAKYGRLGNFRKKKMYGVWCADEEDKQPWFQVDFLRMTTVTHVKIGTDSRSGYVTKYMIKYSYDGNDWFSVRERKDNQDKVFQGLRTSYIPMKSEIKPAIITRFIRLYPIDRVIGNCLQAEFFGCLPGKDCNYPVGIEKSNKIPDDSMTSSSTFKKHRPSNGRLNATSLPKHGHWGGWCPADNDMSPWLQVDLKYVREISKLQTQGHPYKTLRSWVYDYTFSYSLGGKQWIKYGGKNMTFEGNKDSNTPNINELKPTVFARFVRFYPLKFHIMRCMRVELNECLSKEESIPKLVQGIKDVAIKRGESHSFSCIFSGQPNITVVWYRNYKFLQTTGRISTRELNQGNSMLIFKRITDEDEGVIFTCVARYPMVNQAFSHSDAIINVLSLIPSIELVNVTSTYAIFLLNFTGPATRDIIGIRIQTTSQETWLDHTVLVNVSYNNRTSVMNVSRLYPNVNYTAKVAMLYIKDEVGKFYSSVSFKTHIDRPSGAPTSLSVRKDSHDSLHCVWEPPQIKERNGLIISYELQYKKSIRQDDANSGGASRTFNLTTNKTRATLTSLEPGAIYEVTVRAFTMIGAGPFVNPPTLTFTGRATEELTAMKKMVVTDENAVSIGNRLKNITSDPKYLNKHDVVLTLDILEKVVAAQNTSESIGESLVQAVSNVLKANKTVLSESEITNRTGTRYVRMLEKWLEGVELKDKELEEESENVIVRKVFVKKLKLEEGIKFAQKDNSVQITIPKVAVLENNTESIYFVYYKKNKFFQGNKRLGEMCVNGFTVVKERVFTPVVSGEVIGRKTKNLSAPVVLKFKHHEITKAKLASTACAYWDYEANNAKGAWSTDGCKLESIVNQTITCHCNHLTNFAAMMDIYAQTSVICGRHKKIISFITVIGCFLSLIGLFFTFLTYFLFRKLLKELAAKVLIQLCIALFVVVLTFVTGIEQTDKPMMCMSVAFVLHYFTLVSFMWMLMEASFMYHAFVRVWPPRQGGDIYRSTIVAWGVPLFIVVITFLTSMDSYGGKKYCLLTGTPLIAAYLAPIGLIILINAVMFIFIMRNLSARPNSNTDQSHAQVASARVRRAAGILILMGLTWAFGFGSLGGARLEFTYLFAIFNASQGFAIFIFYCVAQKRARCQWWAFFTCDNRSENKRNTDSYYFERQRMSSINSNRTNTLQFNRLNSNASSVLVPCNSVSINDQNQSTLKKALNTIEECESPSRSEAPLEFPLLPTDGMVEKEAVESLIQPVLEEDLEESIEEDELLNLKLQVSEEERKAKPPTEDIKQYSSYRALSGALSYDVLNLVKTPSGKNLEKGTFHVKSNDVLQRKSSENLNHRKNAEKCRSMIETLSNHSERIKSLEHINKKEERNSELPSEQLGLMSFKKVDSLNNVSNAINANKLNHTDTFSSATDKTVIYRPPCNRRPNSMDTFKSDVGTMTEIAPAVDGRSKEDIIDWLHNCEQGYDKGSDSDYSSSFYKTSRSSTMTDIASITRIENPSRNEINNHNRRSTEKEILDDLVMGALKGKSTEDTEDESDFSEQGYSASEEDIFDLEKAKSLRKKKSKTRNSGFTKPSKYELLDQQSAQQSSYV